MAIARQTALREAAARSTFVQLRTAARKNSSGLCSFRIADFRDSRFPAVDTAKLIFRQIRCACRAAP